MEFVFKCEECEAQLSPNAWFEMADLIVCSEWRELVYQGHPVGCPMCEEGVMGSQDPDVGDSDPDVWGFE